MTNLTELLATLGLDVITSPAQDLKEALKLITSVQYIERNEREIISTLYKNGPSVLAPVTNTGGAMLESLEKDGYIVRIVMSGDDNYLACTRKGAVAHKLIQAGV